jgi:hypothetical protein
MAIDLRQRAEVILCLGCGQQADIASGSFTAAVCVTYSKCLWGLSRHCATCIESSELRGLQ